MNKRIMVISPHHDDEVIGCGGSICLHKSLGNEITVVFFASGWSGIPWLNTKKEATAVIQKEAASAGKVLGVDKIIELNFQDRSFPNPESVMLSLISALREIRPNIVYLPNINDGDSEHRFVNSIAQEALWISSSDYFPELGKKAPAAELILGYEVWRPMEIYQLSVDITKFMSVKESAMAIYNSQLQQKNWCDAIRSLNRFRGVISGKGEYVEVFQVIKVNPGLLNL